MNSAAEKISRYVLMCFLIAVHFFACKTRKYDLQTTPESNDRSLESHVTFLSVASECSNPSQNLQENVSQQRWKRADLVRYFAPGACALALATPSLLTALALPPSAKDSLLPQSESACLPAPYLDDVTTSMTDLISTPYRAPSLESAKKLSIPCELPGNIAVDNSGTVQNQIRWRLSRVFLSHIMLAGSAASGTPWVSPASAQASRFLLHYLMGSGKNIVLKDSTLLTDIKKTFLKKWVADNKPELGSMFVQYKDLDGQPSLVGTLGRFPMYFLKLDDGRFAIWINDLYTFPFRSDNETGAAAGASRHGVNTWFGTQARVIKKAIEILGKEDSKEFIFTENNVEGDQYSLTTFDSFFNNFKFVGAKDFRMFAMAVVDPTLETIEYVDPPVGAKDFQNALKIFRPTGANDFAKMAAHYAGNPISRDP